MTVVSVAFGVLSAVLGLFASIRLDIPTGAAIILLQGLAFFIFVAIKRRRN
jgi:ABC-type Mn2+/Zn2+ transport system permease subunit